MGRKKRSKRKGKWIILAVFMLVMAILVVREDKKVVICIDAGHGGSDVGSVSSDGNRYEKDDTLAVALKVKEELEKEGIVVILTREDDTYVSLEKRCQIANRRRADRFVSIHRNSAKNGDGIEIWITAEEREADQKLAESILQELNKTKIQTNRGVKQGTSEDMTKDYYVNQYTSMPSCLIELGFITNKTDNQLLDDYLEEYAKAIARGILEDVKID